MQMQLGIESHIPDGLLAANALLAENSRQGVPTSTHTLHRGFQFAISSTYMGLQFRCYESASDPVDAPSKNVFTCASEFAGKYSIAGGLQALGIGTSGVGGFITNALGGNAFSGATDLIQSLGSGEGGGHSVFYNMGQGVVAGPTQGFGAAFGGSIEGTPWASGASDVTTAAIAGGAFSAATGAGQTIQTLNGAASLASTGLEAAEFASGVGLVKFGYDALSYGAGLLGCKTGVIH
jgi:hypothetical protein